MRSAATTSPWSSATTTDTGPGAWPTTVHDRECRSCVRRLMAWARLYHGRVAVFERSTLSNGTRVLTAPLPQAQSVSCLVMFAAGSRYETPRVERHRALRRAHVLQGHRAPADRTRHRRRDRRHRRRVQRVHRQGADRLLRQVRRRDARHRARRARRHAPQLEVRRRRDRAGEGRHRRGDEHVLRHAPVATSARLRAPAVRRPAARLGHHRQRGDGARRDPGHVPRLPRPLVPARSAW